jgi:hypothetical protein
MKPDKNTCFSPFLMQVNILNPDSFTGVREACWQHQHSGNQVSIFVQGYFPNALPLLTPDI